MDFEDLSPIAVLLGLCGGLIGLIMVKRMPELGMLWRVLTPFACAFTSWLVVQKMSDD